jgi:phospholipid transport system substrate-binding protein
MKCCEVERHAAPFLFILLFVSVAAAMGPPLQEARATSATDFIGTLGSQAIEVLRANTSPAEKAAYFHQALDQDFDLPAIARFVLGPYWRLASPAQRQQFKHLLEDYLVRFYGQRLAEYRGESFRVTGSRSSPSGEVVTSEIIRPSGSPIQVDWRLSIEDGRYKITDVSIDGVSMALTQRAQFAQIIQRNGGQIAGLLATMREQTGESVGSSTPGR